MPSLLVTGTTGNVGREVANALKARGVPFKVATRHAEQAGEAKTYLDLEQPETFLAALEGVDKIFLIRPPQIADAKKYFLPFLNAAKQQHVKHIVFLSLMGVERNKIVPHAKIEKYILDSGIAYTFLRPSFFLQNLQAQHGQELKQENIIYVPAGKGRTSFIDARDIGEVGALCLLDDNHLNKAYTLTGSEALTYYQVAEILTQELGRPITYANPSGRQFRKHELAKGIPSGLVTIMSLIYLTAKIGLAKKVTPELAQLLGRPPRTVRDYAHDYRDQL
ncbi:NAD(P)-dependent oxidoreductase [Dictyobacter alpinus]|uniref:NAD(P)-dependent oxidoreductase n=1 Tax=Dictyobacter alpinus TaxID=2014873 RepID=A0A402B094_9CHLR|nr:SDR family oxidoreductase [Dictyobacter alpinus]GCE24781.1 NAD(P)-dependent oxidoreductase [Dictyobacter alpinus]